MRRIMVSVMKTQTMEQAVYQNSFIITLEKA